MDEKYDVSELVRVVPVERVTFVSTREFDDVVAAIYSGLGRPDNFAALVQRLAAADDAETFDAAVAEAAGSAGLIEFLSLDLGEALAKHPGYQHYRLLRIIAGNPVTMASMTTTVADAGSYAPVTILVAERPDGVHLCLRPSRQRDRALSEQCSDGGGGGPRSRGARTVAYRRRS